MKSKKKLQLKGWFARWPLRIPNIFSNCLPKTFSSLHIVCVIIPLRYCNIYLKTWENERRGILIWHWKFHGSYSSILKIRRSRYFLKLNLRINVDHSYLNNVLGSFKISRYFFFILFFLSLMKAICLPKARDMLQKNKN